MPALTSTSYAVLALLALQPWTTYQLARQMERSLGWIWPRAISRLYEEPKKLVAAGLAASRPGATGRRRSTVYTITQEGRQALAAWLAEPGSGPVLECEALVKIAYAYEGSRDGLLANLAALVDDTTAKLHVRRDDRRNLPGGPRPVPRPPAAQRADVAVPVGIPHHHAPVGTLGPGAGPGLAEDLSQLDVTAEFSRIVSAASSPRTDW